MSEGVIYIGRDLEAMSFAVKYHRWILEIFEPHLGRKIVEVGAGTGSFSEMILERGADALALVEPSRAMYQTLAARVQEMDARATRIETFNAVFPEVAESVKGFEPDSIIYVNVLEHVEDDEAELRLVRETLAKSGRVFIFVPAFQWLYGSFDEQVGHFRRYTKRELEEKVARAGFRTLRSGYFDFAGILPWWVKYRLLKSDRMEAGAVRFYDRYIVPPMKAVETMLPPPVGKNIFLIAEKE